MQLLPVETWSSLEYGYGYEGVYFHIFDEKEVVGRIGTFLIDGEEYSDIFLEPQHRGKGYVKEAYKLLFAILKLKKISAFINKNNIASIKSHEKIGFKLVKCVDDKLIYEKYEEII
jgi:RimJ/RimL family protein N-acetyltransferase